MKLERKRSTAHFWAARRASADLGQVDTTQQVVPLGALLPRTADVSEADLSSRLQRGRGGRESERA